MDLSQKSPPCNQSRTSLGRCTMTAGGEAFPLPFVEAERPRPVFSEPYLMFYSVDKMTELK